MQFLNSRAGKLAVLGILASCAGGNSSSGSQDTAVAETSIERILEGEVAEGDTVSITGTCLGYGTPSAVGPPPRTRSDWQMQMLNQDPAIWVVGALPAGCSYLTGSDRFSTIVAVVSTDSVLASGWTEKVKRYFLVRMDSR